MRKLKKLAFQAGEFSGDRKMKGKVAGIPAKEKPIDLGKRKDSVQEKNDLQVDDDEFQVRNEVVQGLKQNGFELEIPTDSGDSTNGEDDGDQGDSEGLGYAEEDGDEDLEEEEYATGTENGESEEDDEDGDEAFAGEMGSDDSGGETNGSELENTHHSEGKLSKQSASKNTTGKTSNKRHEHVAGENIIGKSRRKNSVDGMSKTELEKIHLKGVMVRKPGHQGKNTGKSSNEVVKGVAGRMVEKVNAKGNRDFGDLRRRAELGNTLCSEAKLPQLSGGKNDTGMATNECSKSRATKLNENPPCTGTTGNAQACVEVARAGSGLGKTFAQLFKSENANGNGFQLQLTGEVNSDNDLKIEDGDVEETTEAWGHSLIGYIAGKNPSYNAVIGFCKSWTKKCRVHFDSSGWIVVKFDEEEDLKRILEGGPYLIYGKPFIVKAMPKYFCYDKSEICKAQVWVNLPHLPLELWTEKALSKIGSRIGHPILVDSITASKERASFARILVEVDLAKVLREDIALILPNGRRIVQEVRYEHLPSYCEDCHAIGHDTKTCARRRKQAEGRKEREAEVGPTPGEPPKPRGAPSELISQKVSLLSTFDASSSSKVLSMGESDEESEEKFVEYVSKNRKKALAKAKRPSVQVAEGSRPSGQGAGGGRPNGIVSEGPRPNGRDSTRGEDLKKAKARDTGVRKAGGTKETARRIAPPRGP